MAEINPPSYLQNGAHSALSDRLTLSALLQPGASGLSSRGGVRATGDGNGLAVAAASTANNTVTVRAGTGFVVEADGTGVYVVHNDSDRVLTVPSASTTQSRRDLVVAQVNDSTFTGVADNWALTIVTGTPSSGTPVAPLAPNNALVLAEYLVPAGTSTNVTNANITDRRINLTALGGVMSVLSTALPINPYRSMSVWCIDTEEMRVWNGSAWRVQSFYPLPSPTKTYYNGQQTLTSAAFAWANLPTRVNQTFTAPKAMLVLLTLGVWLRASDPSDARAMLAVTGATTGPGTGGSLQESGGNWGEVPLSSVSAMSLQCNTTIPMFLNAGSHTIEVQGMRSAVGSTPQVNYPAFRVIPLRYT